MSEWLKESVFFFSSFFQNKFPLLIFRKGKEIENINNMIIMLAFSDCACYCLQVRCCPNASTE